MRIPSGVTDQYCYFVAVDATDFTTRETGLSSFTVYRSRNGGAAAAMTTPTINETDATNMPGVYELLCDEDMTIDAGDDSQEMVFHITHAGMAPVTRTIELYRPKITAGNTLGVASDGDVSGNVDGSVASVVGNVGGNVSGSVGSISGVSFPTNFSDLAITVTTGRVTVGTNADKTGYSISGTKTTLDALNDLTAAQVNTEVDNALADANLDHLVGTATGIPAVPAGTFLDQIMDDGTATYDRTTDSLQAVRDRGDAAWITATGFSTLDAAGVRSAIGMASANLDTQIAALPTAVENADTLLDRDMSTGTDSGSATVRTVRQALRFLRNKWSIAAGTLTVTKEDDTTTSWTGAVSTSAGDPVSSVDPADA